MPGACASRSSSTTAHRSSFWNSNREIVTCEPSGDGHAFLSVVFFSISA
jgi:hypothetical protein